MNVIVINPPLVQLNTPYPSGAYLTAFFKGLKFSSKWYDLNIDLFYSIFSKKGLEKLFDLSWQKALKMADDAEKSGDQATAFNLRRYISCRNYWCDWIDFITQVLRGDAEFSTREKQHQFLYSPFVPRGSRMENFLSSLESEPDCDDVRMLASYALADLADYITAVFDRNFSLIRYAEEVCFENINFSQVEKCLDSPVMKEYLLPLLHKKFFEEDKITEKTLVCISVPFAGTFVSALLIARFFKQTYGDKVFVSLGGGYVNTELRDFNSKDFYKYADVLSFDRGYGSYKELFDSLPELEGGFPLNKSLYKLRQFSSDFVRDALWEDKAVQNYEDEVTKNNIPDFSDIDFSLYPRVCDDKNPMHRLWSDGAWLKVYLAHGCYWHKCAFCDTKLDYVCAYKTTNVKELFYSLLKTAKEKGVYGIHFVDEALPPSLLKQFARLNAQNGNLLYYWGNIRFEKAFTKDLAAFLSYCGLGGVSAGIESATGSGLENINKGTDIASIINACAAFKEAGILVHAYMIYGFWNDTAQTIIDSMETLRQIFEAGLLDSSFWHKFMLTKNSTLYDQLKDSWDGGKEFYKYGPGLDAALESWMHSKKLQTKVTKWFDFSLPSPKIPLDFVEKQIEVYERINAKCDFSDEKKWEVYWLGTKPLLHKNQLHWFYLQEEFVEKDIPQDLADLLWKLRPQTSDSLYNEALALLKEKRPYLNLLKKLHQKGLVIL